MPVEVRDRHGDQIIDKTVKVQGTLKAGTLADATADARFVLSDAENAKLEIPVKYQGALSAEMKDGVTVVLLGSLGAGGSFIATEVALGG